MIKLFFFNPNDYGQEYSVMSDSKENALEAIKKHLLETSVELDGSVDMKEYNLWKDATVENLPKEYSIDIFEKDSVIETYNG